MAKKYIIIIFILIIAVGFMIYFVSTRKHFKENTYYPSVEIIKKSIEEKSENPPYYEIDFKYPQFADLDNINNSIKENVLKISNDFKDELLEEACLQKDIPCSLLSSYETYRNDKIISIKFEYYSYSGGAHGLTSTSALNYRINDNKELLLEDMFRKNTAYLDRISQYCVKSLKERLLAEGLSDENWIEEGAGPDLENYLGNVWISQYGLMVAFSPYQVASYAAGQQSILIPYNEIEDIINPEIVIHN